LTSDNAHQQKWIDEAEPVVAAKLAELKLTIELRRKGNFEETVKVIRAGEGKKQMDNLRRILDQMNREEGDLRNQRLDEANAAASGAKSTIVFGTLLCLLVVTAAGFLITRSLSGQIGAAVRHVQSSSAELQSAANQQASGAKESSTAMTEITTTISELLATSRQIAESAQRVAHVAEETSSAARAGDDTVQRTHESVSGIKRQVDMIVTHMLDLGKKSQQIGGILEIINELAEQTNILAINATIEASGAGDAGKRFAVVADEIRKLADRVGGSTKEIRVLIEEIRAAVNTTVMATEGGSKAVDLGARQFAEVTAALKQITELLGTTTEAAREIELSTKQQATAVAQVNVAVSNVAQASKETEVSANQTLQTAGQLAGLSRELTRLIQAPANA
jgi:methyl-accepting chemotaxis protein